MTRPDAAPAPLWTTPIVGFRPARKTIRKIMGFWHIGAVGDWRRIIADQYATLKKSGLYAASDKIVVGFIGGRKLRHALNIPILDDPKFEVFTTDNVEDYEFPTLARVWQEAQRDGQSFLCYYLHTKGASLVATPLQAAANAWRVYMEYFNLERWQDCAATLNEYDTCGVELQSEDSHYSGNFWWATSDYIKRLPDGYQYWERNRDNRGAAEFYLCLAHPRAHCFNDFVENLYDYEIPPEAYRK